jgi:hypothetical protein
VNRNLVPVSWVVGGVTHECERLLGACPLCFAQDCVVALPPPLLSQQPDDTTHVCLPALGGCNQGFARTKEVSP